MIRVVLKLLWKHKCSKMWTGVVFPFKYFFGGILDRGKGCVVTANPCAGKLWIGVGTAEKIGSTFP